MVVTIHQKPGVEGRYNERTKKRVTNLIETDIQGRLNVIALLLLNTR